MLTQSELKSILHYNHLSGHLTWIKSPSNQHKHKQYAGSISEKGYIRIWVDGKHHMAHRLIFLYMTGSLPKHQVDHINHIRDDNRWCNLRLASGLDNMKNKSIYKNNSTDTTGVNYDKKDKRYVARIQVNGKMIQLGRYKNKLHAVYARLTANKTYDFHTNHGLCQL